MHIPMSTHISCKKTQFTHRGYVVMRLIREQSWTEAKIMFSRHDCLPTQTRNSMGQYEALQKEIKVLENDLCEDNIEGFHDHYDRGPVH